MINVMHLKQSLLLQSMGKMSSMKLVPGAKKIGNHWSIRYKSNLEEFLNIVP